MTVMRSMSPYLEGGFTIFLCLGSFFIYIRRKWTILARKNLIWSEKDFKTLKLKKSFDSARACLEAWTCTIEFLGFFLIFIYGCIFPVFLWNWSSFNFFY